MELFAIIFQSFSGQWQLNMLLLNRTFLNCFTALLLASDIFRTTFALIEPVTENGKKILTSRHCDEANEDESEYNAAGKSIEKVDLNAFVNCTQIDAINLSDNKIRELDKKTFESQRKLTKLKLHCNYITFLPNELFAPLKNLMTLSLDENPLKTLEFLYQGNLVHLAFLRVLNIDLLDIDVNKTMTNLPQLKTINFAYNFLNCDTYNKAKEIFNAKNIVVWDFKSECASNKTEKCLANEEWEVRMWFHKQQQLQMIIKRKQAEADMKTYQTLGKFIITSTILLARLQQICVSYWWILVSLLAVSCAAFFSCFLRTRTCQKKKADVPKFEETSKLSVEDNDYSFESSQLETVENISNDHCDYINI